MVDTGPPGEETPQVDRGWDVAGPARDDPRSVGRSVAAPLAVFGLVAFVVGAVRMVTGVDQSFVVLLGGVFLLAGAFTAFRLGERAGSSDATE